MADLHGGPGGFEPEEGDHGLCGVYYAIVTQNKDDQNLARIRVRYPWLSGGDVDQSFWAPICVPMIGGEFGTYTLPEIEDTVLVVFLAGDIRYPVVIGGAWSETDPPPVTNEDGKNDFRGIRSRSGHELLLDDSDSAKLVLNSKSGEEILSCGSSAGGGSDGASLSSGAGTLSILCPSGTLKVEGKDVEVTSSDKADIKAGSALEVGGSASASFSSSSMGKYEGSTTNLG